MKKIRILGIAPYEGMRDMMVNIAAERNDIELTAYVGDLEKGAEIAKAHLAEGYDAIISRGGTALAIKEITDTVVFGVTLSYYDVLSAIKLAENYNGKFAIVGFPDIADFARQLCEILQYDIYITTTSSKENTEKTILSLREQGYSLIIGDVISSRYAKEIGLNSMLITSGSESIRSSFDQVVDICRYYSTYKNENFFYKINRQVNNEHILVYGDSGVLLFHAADQDKSALEVITKRLLPAIHIHKEQKVVKAVNGKTFLITGHTHTTSFQTYYIFNATRLLETGEAGSASISLQNKEDISGSYFSLFYSNNAHKELREAAEKYSISDNPVLILGESGTGKDRMAQLIYSHSKQRHYPCYTVDCQTITPQELTEFLNDQASPFYEQNNTFYFRHISRLNETMLDQLFAFMKKSQFHRRNRLLFSLLVDPARQETAFLQNYLKFQLDCLTLKLPPLRQRIDDIPSIANLYINDFNVVHGKQLAGIEPEAMSLLQGYNWPDNLNQFKHILNQASVLTEGPYISAATIYNLLRSESTSAVTDPDLNSPLNLNQTLADITYDIVQAVLAKENMNQTRAAKKLGISRTTLWRIINQK